MFLCRIAAVYLVQGILGLARLAVSYFLKDELQLDPATVSAVCGGNAVLAHGTIMLSASSRVAMHTGRHLERNCSCTLGHQTCVWVR